MRNETTQEKEKRIFEVYKKDLQKLAHGTDKKIRFLAIEYVCSFPKIDPYKMAKALQNDGYTLIFDYRIYKSKKLQKRN